MSLNLRSKKGTPCTKTNMVERESRNQRSTIKRPNTKMNVIDSRDKKNEVVDFLFESRKRRKVKKVDKCEKRYHEFLMKCPMRVLHFGQKGNVLQSSRDETMSEEAFPVGLGLFRCDNIHHFNSLLSLHNHIVETLIKV